MEEPEMPIADFLETSKTFELVLPEEDDDKSMLSLFGRSPRGVTSDKEMFLITGGRFNFKTILLKANSKEWIKLRGQRFGVVQDIEGEISGSRIFQVRIYMAKKEGSISLDTVDGANEVFLVPDEGKKEQMTPIDTKKYDESMNDLKKGSPLEQAKKILPFLNTLARYITAGANVAEVAAP